MCVNCAHIVVTGISVMWVPITYIIVWIKSKRKKKGKIDG